MSLTQELDALAQNSRASLPPEVQTVFSTAIQRVADSDLAKTALNVGDAAPDFTLPGATGETVSLGTLLAKGPVLLTFYRGEWCPYCNLALRALQAHLAEFQAHDVSFVAISPEKPDFSLTMKEKGDLAFPVLSDVGNVVARLYGVLTAGDDTLQPVFTKFGIDLPGRNGDDSLELPIPATFLIDTTGTILNRFLDPDYKKRLDPEEALRWVSAL